MKTPSLSAFLPLIFTIKKNLREITTSENSTGANSTTTMYGNRQKAWHDRGKFVREREREGKRRGKSEGIEIQIERERKREREGESAHVYNV